MKISEIIQRRRPSLSFEFYPPRNEIGFWDLYRTIEALKPLDPTYVSVTYGAGGTTRRQTVELVGRIKADVGIESVAHLTCTGDSKSQIADIIDDLWSKGVHNILALRGDPAEGSDTFVAREDGFAYAIDLVTFLKQRRDFCVGGACHPEVHPEAPSPEADLDNLKRKVDAGCDYLVTQMFFDNEDFYRFRDKARSAGVEVPIITGIMPILSVKQIKKFSAMCGAKIPADLLGKIEGVEDDTDAVRQIGTIHALQQCEDLIDNDVAGIHLYTLNLPTATRAIFQHIKGRIHTPSKTTH